MNSETNHNWWTLTKHVAHSVNSTAAKIDITIYGPKTNPIVQTKNNAVVVQPPKPAPRPVNPNAPSGGSVAIGAIILLVLVGIILLRKIRI